MPTVVDHVVSGLKSCGVIGVWGLGGRFAERTHRRDPSRARDVLATRVSCSGLGASAVRVLAIVAVIAWVGYCARKFVGVPPKPTAIGHRPGLTCTKNPTN
jgi:hypothetical protein